METASQQSSASAIWKSALLFVLFEQSYYKVKGKFVYAFLFLGIVHMLYHLLCILEFEKNKLFDFDFVEKNGGFVVKHRFCAIRHVNIALL